MISDLWVADKFKTIIWWGSFTWDYRWDRINPKSNPKAGHRKLCKLKNLNLEPFKA